MFGYIFPYKPEMKIKEFETYRAYYCGMCKEIHKQYGVFSRLLLNYDLVFLAMMKDALGVEKGEARHEGCIINPIAKQIVLHNTGGLAFGADGLMLLSYHKLLDNLQDEKPIKRLGYLLAKPYLYYKYKKATSKHAGIDKLLTEQMQKQAELEKDGCTSVDIACDPTAQMCRVLFEALAQNDSQKQILGRLGIFAGQIIYLLDAADDYEKDIKSGNYNVFVQQGISKEDAVVAVRTRCRMAAGEMAAGYNLLDLKRNKAIIDNILFLGIPAAINAAGMKHNGRKTGHGQISSI